VAQAAVARHRLETVEAWTRSLRRTATPRRRPGFGGQGRWKPAWSLAAQQQPSALPLAAKRLLQITRPDFHRRAATCIQRAAGYGPVCPVWEGRSREASPYPDCGQDRLFAASLACTVHARSPTGARVRLQRLGLRAVFWIDRIVEPSIALIRYAWRKAFIVTGATIHPAIILTRILTAILATILPRAKTVLRASILSSVLLGDRGT